MLPRFFAPEAGQAPSIVALPDDEAAHLARVLRLGAGDHVRVFDGRGGEWLATVAEVRRARVTVRIGERVETPREPAVAISLAVAVLKADHMDAVVRDAVMLGVSAVVPLLSERVDVSARQIERGGRLARWQRIAVSSAKQCGRAVVPPIHPPQEVAALLAAAPAGVRVTLVEPGADGRSAISIQQLPRSETVELLVGPEGGWTRAELDLAASRRSMLLTLGSQTLRAVSAPIVAISAIRAVWDDL